MKDVKTTVVEKVPESAEAERVMEKLISQGNRLIFSTSYGYLEPAQRVAKRHPEVTIIQTWRPSQLKNVGFFAVNQYEALYVAGIVAGRMTKKNSIGFVCAHPVPILVQNINAFTLGARSVNPKAKVKVVWTNSWSDPPAEAEATRSLIDSGVDVIGSVLDSPLTVARAADQAHIMIIGSQSDFHKLVPNYWLVGSHWNWENVYLQIAKSVQDGTWKKDERWLGLKEDAIGLSPFGRLVPAPVQKEALAQLALIKQGKQEIFKGPLKDRDGKLRLAAGQAPDLKWLAGMDWFVQGVEGTLPKHQ